VHKIRGLHAEADPTNKCGPGDGAREVPESGNIHTNRSMFSDKTEIKGKDSRYFRENEAFRALLQERAASIYQNKARASSILHK